MLIVINYGDAGIYALNWKEKDHTIAAIRSCPNRMHRIAIKVSNFALTKSLHGDESRLPRAAEFRNCSSRYVQI
jgi:hypothetical protein